jgi:nitroreductase
MVRNYDDKPVDRAAIERIVAVAAKSPSAGFTQGQYLVVITDAGVRKQIADLADEAEYVAMGMPAWISGAPVHIVVCTSEADYHRRYQEPDKLQEDGTEISWPVPYWHTDAGAALMLILLAAVDEGLAAGFFGFHRLPGLHDLLGIPDEIEPIGVVTLGHPAAGQPGSSARRGRKAPETVVHWERW